MKIISTKSELEKAIQNKETHFIVKGELAEKIQRSRKITTLDSWSLGILTVAIGGIVLSPATGGVSGAIGLSAASAVATLTGIEIAVILAVAFVGIGLIMAIYKDYDITFKINPETGEFEGEFKRK
ncbi:hypothetical protein Q7506_03250 [Glaesserella parasuis]|nr:hypothetical protein [Glaesserella parasuis]